MRNFLVFISFLFFFSCSGDRGRDVNSLQENQCSYQELLSTRSKEQYEDGRKSVKNIAIQLEANTKLLKLGKGAFQLGIEDTLNIDNITKNVSQEVVYSSNFVERHNSIIQILCAIEKDLLDTTISKLTRRILYEEKIRKRSDYFNLLLEGENKPVNIIETTAKKITKKDSPKIKNTSKTESQKSGITANRVSKQKKDKNNKAKDLSGNTIINEVSSVNQQGGITANEVIFNQGNPQRKLNSFLESQMLMELNDQKDKTIEVECILGDGEGFIFATEIKKFLEGEGFKVSLSQSIFSQPISGQILDKETSRVIIGTRE